MESYFKNKTRKPNIRLRDFDSIKNYKKAYNKAYNELNKNNFKQYFNDENYKANKKANKVKKPRKVSTKKYKPSKETIARINKKHRKEINANHAKWQRENKEYFYKYLSEYRKKKRLQAKQNALNKNNGN